MNAAVWVVVAALASGAASDFFGVHYGNAGDQLGMYPCNFSYGVGWRYPPAPPTVALLGMGALAARRRR